MAEEKEAFLSRWSRVKREAVAEAQKPVPAAPAVGVPEKPLPPVEQLKFESDFTAFMQSKVVDEGVKRAALKKLFADPRFNVMDGLDTYIDDYSIEDPISPELLERLQHAKRTLFGPEPEKTVADSEGEAAPSDQPEPQADTPVAEDARGHVDRG